MRISAASAIAIVVGVMGPSAASAQHSVMPPVALTSAWVVESVSTPAVARTSAWVVDSVPTAARPYPVPRIRFSESQIRGMRWGAQIGIVAGFGIAWLIAENDDCSSYECVNRAASLPFYIGVGVLGGMVVGGAVGLGIGTWIDDDGQSEASPSLRVTLHAP